MGSNENAFIAALELELPPTGTEGFPDVCKDVLLGLLAPMPDQRLDDQTITTCRWLFCNKPDNKPIGAFRRRRYLP